MNPRVRRVDAHDPERLPHTEYMRQVFWGTGMDLPDDLESAVEKIVLDAVELAPGEKASLSLTLPPAFAIVFDPVTHTTVFLDVAGEPTNERRQSVAHPERHAFGERQARTAPWNGQSRV